MSFLYPLFLIIAVVIYSGIGLSNDSYKDDADIIEKQGTSITYNKVHSVYVYFGVSSEDSVLMQYHQELENVPDNIQEVLNKKGLRINFYKGRINDIIDLITPIYKNINETYLKEAYRERFYDPNTNNIFISCDKYVEMALHEYGHAFDFNLCQLVGEPEFISKSPRFNNIYNKYRDKITSEIGTIFNVGNKTLNYIKTSREEFFAQLFAWYYSPDLRHRKALEKIFPEFVTFIEKIEEKILLDY